MVYHFKINKEDKGYSAECVEIPGCVTQGDSMKELYANMHEVLNLLLEEPEDSGVVFPEPRRIVKGHNIAEVYVEPHIAFALRLKQMRARRRITQRTAADMLGIKTLYTYQKLESASTANPELKTLVKIKKAFPDFKIDEILMSENRAQGTKKRA